jgi:glycosyltransferase involved in cell wall biosynthesis
MPSIDLSVIIPVRAGSFPAPTLKTLSTQLRDAEVIIVWDQDGRGANWARNRGAERARGDLLLFSDDDIAWRSGAIAMLRRALDQHPEAAWSYGAYAIEGHVQCAVPWDPDRLRRSNYISTMSMVRRETFPGFDETIMRLQDWDLWLQMLAAGHRGVYCDSLVFTTELRDGITRNGPVDYDEAVRIVRRKHGL